MSASAEPPTSNLATGKAAYERSCARCHGVEGRGDGLDAKRFYPRPRDFTLGVYKFRSTASGAPPSDEDLFRTITQGLPGTNMPDWPHLDEATRWQLVYYLKSLTPSFQQQTPTLIEVAPDPGIKQADRAKGKALYQQLGCAACHGAQGRANGTSAAGLVDDWGKPIRPADLTQGWTYRGGSEPQAIMTRVLAGIDGAGMPSYAGALSPRDAWQLAYYVASLQEPTHWNAITHATYVHGTLPMTNDDPRWRQAERSDVRLRNAVTPEGEWAAPPTIKAAVFQVLYNDEAMAVRLTWDDPSQDTAATPDAAALIFQPSGMRGDVVTLQAWPYAGAPALDFCRWSADQRQAMETVATTLEDALKPSTAQALPVSVASYEDGRWQLIMQRPLHPEVLTSAAEVTAGAFTPIAFMIWDGANPSARAISPWVEIALRKR